MKYDFFKFNRKQILKRKNEEKITITRYDFKLMLCYKFMFYLCVIFASGNFYFFNNKLIGFCLCMIAGYWLIDTIFEMERFDNDN